MTILFTGIGVVVSTMVQTSLFELNGRLLVKLKHDNEGLECRKVDNHTFVLRIFFPHIAQMPFL